MVQHPEISETLVVAFGERYMAEAVSLFPLPPSSFLLPLLYRIMSERLLIFIQFIDATLPLLKADPAIGNLEMEWVANDAFPFTNSSPGNGDSGAGDTAAGGDGDGDEEMGDVAEDGGVKAEQDADGEGGDAKVKEEDGDLDVAEDEDRWL